MKTLATCKPSEFLKQTNLIRKSVEKWMTETDIANIRKRMPVFTKIEQGMSKEEKEQIFEENKRLSDAQARANLSAILDAVLEDHPEDTLEVLALCCFIDPAEVDDHSVGEFLEAFSELISNKAVLNFFSSLVQLGQTNI